MHRRPLLDLLERYERRHPGEPATARIRALVERHADCLERHCLPGHVTGSAWIVSPCGHRVLLTHHRKLGRWLQLGGHVDGDPDVAAAALREAREESGSDDLELAREPDGSVVPLDLDVHRIPARGAEPAHEHHDLRFLVWARSTDIRASAESLDLRWVAVDELHRFTDEESVLRLTRKAALRAEEPRSSTAC
ncbi:MAG: NUDIX domain-containing protein [Ectothiorhodospiraceae bacterium]|nr:NUDIX domain-containing protein [Ectothiorhodospiraceae bacterium]